jgi:hypothetical protein
MMTAFMAPEARAGRKLRKNNPTKTINELTILFFFISAPFYDDVAFIQSA